MSTFGTILVIQHIDYKMNETQKILSQEKRSGCVGECRSVWYMNVDRERQTTPPNARMEPNELFRTIRGARKQTSRTGSIAEEISRYHELSIIHRPCSDQ